MKAPNSHLRNNSGQMLIITSLVVVLLLISTVVYVKDIEKNVPVYIAEGDQGLSAVKQDGLHTLVSALANISMGGNRNVLSEDLNRLKSAVENHQYKAISELDFEASNSAPYSNGVWISGGNNGTSVSSIYVLFTLNSTGNSASYYSEYAINVTSSITSSGTYIPVNESANQVTVTCNVFNEGKPASADNLTFYFEQNGTAWVPATSSSIIDRGDGTYVASFLAQSVAQNTSLPILLNLVDSRGISVWTNITCIQK